MKQMQKPIGSMYRPIHMTAVEALWTLYYSDKATACIWQDKTAFYFIVRAMRRTVNSLYVKLWPESHESLTRLCAVVAG